MPKVVDHTAYRLELATKAADVFIEHGYNGLGMRGIAEAIGVSKSALYHYFPSKKALLAACTELVTTPQNIYGTADDGELPLTKEDAILAMLTTLDERFQGEMAISLDYIRGRKTEDVAEDPLMKMFNTKYTDELINIVGKSNAEQAFSLMFGGLMLRMVNGKQTELKAIAAWVLALSD